MDNEIDMEMDVKGNMSVIQSIFQYKRKFIFLVYPVTLTTNQDTLVHKIYVVTYKFICYTLLRPSTFSWWSVPMIEFTCHFVDQLVSNKFENIIFVQILDDFLQDWN